MDAPSTMVEQSTPAAADFEAACTLLSLHGSEAAAQPQPQRGISPTLLAVIKAAVWHLGSSPSSSTSETLSGDHLSEEEHLGLGRIDAESTIAEIAAAISWCRRELQAGGPGAATAPRSRKIFRLTVPGSLGDRRQRIRRMLRCLTGLRTHKAHLERILPRVAVQEARLAQGRRVIKSAVVDALVEEKRDRQQAVRRLVDEIAALGMTGSD